jgi:subfamily B ATP-binding cassette protein MsbA
LTAYDEVPETELENVGGTMQRFSVAAYLAAARRLNLSIGMVVTLLAIELAVVVFEFGGVAMLVPVFEFMQQGGSLEKLGAQSRYWHFIIDAHRVAGFEVSLASLLGVSFLLILLRQAATYIRVVYRVTVRQALAHDLRRTAFGSFLRANFSYQRDTRQGEFINDVTIELPKAVNAVFDTILVLGHFLLIAAYSCALFYLSPWMTVLAVIIMGGAGLAVARILRRTERVSKDITDANRRFGTFFAERIRATRLIRLSGEDAQERERLGSLSDTCRERTVKLSRLQALTQVMIEPIAVLMAFAIILIGYTYFDMSPATLGIFVIVLTRLLPVIRSSVSDFQTVLGQWASLAAVIGRLETIADMQETESGTEIFSSLRSGIRYENVGFRYAERIDPALRSISIEFPAGKTVALVGPSGAGKSTLIDLLPRLLEPTSGRITVDGRPLDSFTRRSLRAGIAYAGQEAEVFDGTLRDHICYGTENVSDAALHRALRLSGSADFIDQLPDGLDTVIGENGSRLSGGQRQRIDIARALLLDTPLLILDEPTSQLDAETEAGLRTALKGIRAETDTTIIIVSHGLQLANEADLVAVIINGEISEYGEPKALSQGSGWFSKMSRSISNAGTFSAPDPFDGDTAMAGARQMGSEKASPLSGQRVVVHVGYYKTATTFLQRQLFSRIPAICNLGKPSTTGWPGRMVHDIVYAPDDRFDAAKWKRMVCSAFELAVEGNPNGFDAIVFSNEGLCDPEGYKFLEDDHVPRRLKAIFGDAKILISVRHQATLVESLYVHNAKAATFLPFDKWVVRNQKDVQGLDFAARAALFEAQFGTRNVVILPQEELASDRPSASGRLSRLLGVEPEAVDQAVRHGERENVRKTKRQLVFNHIRSHFFPNVALGNSLPAPVQRILHRYLASGEEAVGIVPQNVAAEISTRFSESNRILAKKFNLPLEKYGYFGDSVDAP